MVDQDAPGGDHPALMPEEQELRRELIQQFYDASVKRYGIDSEQALTSSQLLLD